MYTLIFLFTQCIYSFQSCGNWPDPDSIIQLIVKLLPNIKERKSDKRKINKFKTIMKENAQTELRTYRKSLQFNTTNSLIHDDDI